MWRESPSAAQDTHYSDGTKTQHGVSCTGWLAKAGVGALEGSGLPHCAAWSAAALCGLVSCRIVRLGHGSAETAKPLVRAQLLAAANSPPSVACHCFVETFSTPRCDTSSLTSLTVRPVPFHAAAVAQHPPMITTKRALPRSPASPCRLACPLSLRCRPSPAHETPPRNATASPQPHISTTTGVSRTPAPRLGVFRAGRPAMTEQTNHDGAIGQDGAMGGEMEGAVGVEGAPGPPATTITSCPTHQKPPMGTRKAAKTLVNHWLVEVCSHCWASL